MYYNPLKKKKIDVVVSRTSSYSLLASLLLSLNKKIKIMTYKEANNISIKDYLNSLGIQPAKEKGSYGMYRSPLREDNTPSFKVDYNANLWCDYGTGEGGTLIDLVMKQTRVQRLRCYLPTGTGRHRLFFLSRERPARKGHEKAGSQPDRDTQNTAVTESGTHTLFAGKGDFPRNGIPIRAGNVLPHRWQALFCAGVQE